MTATGTTTVEEPQKIIATPAVGSLNREGKLDVIVGTEEHSGNLGRIFAFGPDGKLLTGWPVRPSSLSASGVPAVATWIISSPVLGRSRTGFLSTLVTARATN